MASLLLATPHLLAALELVVLEPLGEQIGAALLQHGARELDTLHGVELSGG